MQQIDINVEDEAEKLIQQFPPQLLAMAPALRVPIAPGDTVEFPGDSMEGSSFEHYNGRILHINVDRSYMSGGESIPFHPQAHHSPGEPIALIQLAITKRQSLNIYGNAVWQSHSEEIISATNGIEECALSNLLLWISPMQVSRLVPILHVQDCIDQSFGPVYHQKHTLFTHSKALFTHPSDNFTHSLETMPYSQYEAFGPSSSGRNPRHITETEALLSLKHRVTKIGEKCLTSMRAIGGTESISEHMSRGEWAKLVRCLVDLDPTLLPAENLTGNDTRETKHILVHANLSLETKKLANIRQTITARTGSQLHAVRSFCSGNLGTGVRKRPPSLKELQNGEGIKTLQHADTVHMVEVNMHDMMEQAEEQEWISPHATQVNSYFDEARNFIRFKYNYRLRRFTMSLKAVALNVGKCRAEPLMQFLDRNRMRSIQSLWPEGNSDHLVQYPELRIGRGVWHDDDVYVIDAVDVEAGLIMLHNEEIPEMGTSVEITDTAEYRLM